MTQILVLLIEILIFTVEFGGLVLFLLMLWKIEAFAYGGKPGAP